MYGERVEEERNFVVSQEWLHRKEVGEFYRKYVLDLNRAHKKSVNEGAPEWLSR